MRNQHITAEIIADSITEKGDRLTSFIVTLPRIILAEFNTHRMLSRNSSSSRAIPFRKMVEEVQNNPFIPIAWQKDHKGMQGTEYFTEEDYEETDDDKKFKTIDSLDYWWLKARDAAVHNAQTLNGAYGVTKQLCNRLLEPFLYQTVIVTASEWGNFLALRAHDEADIHIADASYKMLEAYNNSTPKLLTPGKWHIPFGDKIDISRVTSLVDKIYPVQPASLNWHDDRCQEIMVKIATARCARVSYLNYEGTDDYEKDVKLHDRLSGMGHWSPFEHCAKAMTETEYATNLRGEISLQGAARHLDIYESGDSPEAEGWSGNFRGFVEYRKMFNEENKTDPRIK